MGSTRQFSTKAEFAQFLKNLAQYPNLVRLNLRGLMINNAPPDESDIELISQALSNTNNRNIQSVDLKGVTLSTESLIHLEEMLHNNKTITGLDFETENQTEFAAHPETQVFRTPTDLNVHYNNKIYDPKTGKANTNISSEPANSNLAEKNIIEEVLETLENLKSKITAQNITLTQKDIKTLKSTPPFAHLNLLKVNDLDRLETATTQKQQLEMIDSLIRTHEQNLIQFQRFISREIIAILLKENQKLKARADALKQKERDVIGVGQRHHAALRDAQLQVEHSQKEREKAAAKEKREKPHKTRVAEKEQAIKGMEKQLRYLQAQQNTQNTPEKQRRRSTSETGSGSTKKRPSNKNRRKTY